MPSPDAEIDPETLARLPDYYAPAVSPDGTEIAFFHDRSGRMELYSLSANDGEWRQWSDGNVPRNLSGGLLWAPDGDAIYFHRDEDGDEQNDVYAIDRDGDRRAVVEPDGQAYLVDVTADGRWLLYVSDERDQLNLYRYDREEGASTRVTDYERPVWPFGAGYAPGDDRIAYATNESPDLDNRDVYVAAADGSDPRRLDVGEEGAETGFGDWFPGGHRLLVDDNSGDVTRVGVCDLRGDAEEVRWLSDGAHEENAAAVSPDGRYALAIRTRRAATVPVVYDVEAGTGRELDLPEGDASVIGDRESGFLDAGTVVLSHSTGDRRSELVARDLDAGGDADANGRRRLVAAEYGDVDPDRFVAPEYVTYESDDYEIGALLYETGGEASPAVVKVHGGPAGQSTQGFDRYTQFLVTQGYTVLEPNYRGSTGRGREFKNAINDDWGGMEQVDVRRGAEWLAANADVDPDRIAVFGGSYGGYSAYCQLTMHPGPWAAGIAWIGITDLLALYEESMPHFKTTLERYMGDPEENEALWRERSPIEHVDGVEAPICILHGENDPRCPISQARRFRDALEERGLEAPEDFEYTELGEEGHGSTDLDQKVRVFELLADYLDRRL